MNTSNFDLPPSEAELEEEVQRGEIYGEHAGNGGGGIHDSSTQLPFLRREENREGEHGSGEPGGGSLQNAQAEPSSRVAPNEPLSRAAPNELLQVVDAMQDTQLIKSITKRLRISYVSYSVGGASSSTDQIARDCAENREQEEGNQGGPGPGDPVTSGETIPATSTSSSSHVSSFFLLAR